MKKTSRQIYMDYAASASPNPSSIHIFGVSAKQKLENARKETAEVLGARPAEIIFTSGGTEGNNLAIQGVVFAYQTKKFLPHIVTTNIEHPSVLETCKLLAQRNLAEVSVVPVEENGIVDPKKIKKEIKENTILVSVMYANNEIGTIQPIREIAKEIRHYKNLTRLQHPLLNKERVGERFPIFHTDAVQAVNYLDLNVERLGVDMLTLSGSKIINSGRVGMLYKRKGINLANIWGGGDQEGGLRPGTENLAEILKFSSVLKKTQSIKEKEVKRLTKLRDYFFRVLDTRHAGVQHPKVLVNGDFENRLPNNINVTFLKIPSDLLVIELSAKGIMASSKSACKSSSSEGSYVIKALHSARQDLAEKYDPEIGGLRFSLGSDTKKQDIDYTIKSLSQILTKLKKWYD